MRQARVMRLMTGSTDSSLGTAPNDSTSRHSDTSNFALRVAPGFGQLVMGGLRVGPEEAVVLLRPGPLHRF